MLSPGHSWAPPSEDFAILAQTPSAPRCRTDASGQASGKPSWARQSRRRPKAAHNRHTGTPEDQVLSGLGSSDTDGLLSEAINARSGRLDGNDLPEWR